MKCFFVRSHQEIQNFSNLSSRCCHQVYCSVVEFVLVGVQSLVFSGRGIVCCGLLSATDRRLATMNKLTPVIVRVRQPLGIRAKSTSSGQTPGEYCLDLVRKHDYENYLCSLLLPNTIRPAAFSVRAFNIEVARVEEQARDVAIGQMRFKFWEDTLDKIYKGSPPRNPVALELHKAVNRHKLSKHYLKRLIAARLEKLTSSIYPNLESVETHAENTSSPVYYLMLEAMGIKDVRVDHAASHLGKAHGITNLVRSILYNANRRTIIVPQDLLIKHKISSEAVLRGQLRKELGNAVFDIASRAKQHLDKTRSLRKDIPKNAAPIFLPVIAIDNYLERLRRVDFDIYHPSVQRRNGLLSLKLYWNHMLSRPF
ncbi:NADH dehydrogenase (ubiquinone) complex I, assembly factor 6 [Athalia rosae]|uniref:NADH dehydrogenase (ubiquinone) complex I, assembly factor 6 n=1 Tax=Athalia rosae TaxID=37344 RepID=UPI0020349909|nr:NADH dehydrogenase (ubiquinone) complex I, assembly factor 6 [Athalia rosae]